MPVAADAGAGRGPRASHPRRRTALLAGGLTLAAIVAVFGILAVTRYLPALDEARRLRADLDAMVDQARDAGLAIDRPTLDDLGHRLGGGRERLARLDGLLADDPLVGLARWFPPTSSDVRGADSIAAAAGALFDAADDGLAIAARYIEIRAGHGADGSDTSTLARLVELMATERERAVAAQAAVGRARDALATVPDGPGGTLAGIRDTMLDRLATYGPILDAYVDVSQRLPSILGWDEPRRYLVLTQNPAEIRPTGGYTGSYGIVAFDRGRVTERTFRDVFLLDMPWTYPFVAPPPELAAYLLGPDQPWQLADANWSPDFPTSAQDAVRLYRNEGGEDPIDGVIGITTHTIDELLEVTGPVDVPEYGATVAAGETTLTAIELTRIGRPGENRKAFLSVFGDHLFERLLGLAPDRWGALIERADTIRDEHLLLAWFADPADQRFASDGGIAGAIRQVPRRLRLSRRCQRRARLEAQRGHDPLTRPRHRHRCPRRRASRPRHPVGQRHRDRHRAPYRAVPTLEDLRILGTYVRLLAPRDSRITAVSGGGLVPLTAPAVVGEEAGRAVFGNYLMIPPGTTRLRYAWTSPSVVDVGTNGHAYRLTIQRQPGQRSGPLTVTVRVPEGFAIAAASAPLTIDSTAAGASASLDFDADVELAIRFGSVAAGQP